MEQMEVENKRELKHLGFVRATVIQTLVWVSSLYDYAKENCGPLKTTVGIVESAVTTLVGPAYNKLNGLPDDLLVILDIKVDEAACKFDKHAPPVAKQVAFQSWCLIHKAAEKAQEVVKEFHKGGPRAAVYFVASDTKYFVLDNSVKAWVSLNKYPTFHKLAEVTLPTAANLSEKYNHVVMDMSGKGYALFARLPLVPVDDISKAFNQGGVRKEVATEDNPVADPSESD